MSAAASILDELRERGLRVRAAGDKVRLEPRRLVTPEVMEQVLRHKSELLAHLRAEKDRAEALALLNRLKTYTLPAGRMPAARAIVERLKPLLAAPEIDPAQALTTLQQLERELVALGGASDPELTEAATIVERAFPGARLVDVRKLQ